MPISSTDIPAVRVRAAARCVVIVRDEGRRWQPLADALMPVFAVRLAANASELMEHLNPIERVACVCVVGGGARLREVHDAFVRVGGAPERLVFVSEDDTADTISRVARRLASL